MKSLLLAAPATQKNPGTSAHGARMLWRKTLKWLLLPVVVLAGLTFATPERAEAARWRVYAGGPYPYYSYRYRAPRYYGWRGPMVAPVYPAPIMVAPRPYRVYYGPPRPVYPAPYYHVW